MKKLALAAILGLTSASSFAGVLLMPNSGNDQVWLLNDFDGSVISTNFIQDTTFSTPINAIDAGNGQIFVSDQILDSVRAYDYNGNFLGEIANAADGLDNIRGIAINNGRLYVTVGGNTGGLMGTIQSFNLDGSGQTTWATLPTGWTSPFEIYFRANDVLVTDSGTDDIARLDLSGTYLGNFYTSPGSNDLNFPQQIAEVTPGGDLYVAGFSLPTGIYKYDNAGNPLQFGSINTGIRGVYQLGNGKVLWTGGTRFGTWDPTTNISTDIVNQAGASFRYLESSAVPEPGTLAVLGLGILALRKRKNRI